MVSTQNGMCDWLRKEEMRATRPTCTLLVVGPTGQHMHSGGGFSPSSPASVTCAIASATSRPRASRRWPLLDDRATSTFINRRARARRIRRIMHRPRAISHIGTVAGYMYMKYRYTEFQYR